MLVLGRLIVDKLFFANDCSPKYVILPGIVTVVNEFSLNVLTPIRSRELPNVKDDILLC